MYIMRHIHTLQESIMSRMLGFHYNMGMETKCKHVYIILNEFMTK